MKIFVVGLDGCSWRLLDRWIEAGELPFMRKIKEEGCWGESESCLPPVTAPNWKCYSTGTNPGKLGIFWWENVDFVNQRLVLPRSDLFHGKDLWDYLGEAGLKVAVVNMPTTFPPKPVNGALVAGGPDALDNGFTYPTHLEQQLRDKLGYSVHPPRVGVIDQDPEAAAKQIIPLLDLRFKAVEHIANEVKPDFIHMTLYYINVLQHHLWDHPLVLEAWKLIDRNLSKLYQKFPDWTFLYMVDHGTNQVVTQFNISRWMEEEGYLVLRQDRIRELLHRVGINRERVAGIAAALGIKNWLKSRLSPEARAFLPSNAGIVPHTGRAALIDWEKSKVVPSGQGPIYLNPRLTSSELSALRRELKSKLSGLKDDLGNPIVKQIFEREEIYRGPHLRIAPDLVIDQADGIHISASVGYRQPFQRPTKWLAENHKFGLFGALGPCITRGRLAKSIRIVDIAPTILHAYGLPISPEIDGEVLKVIFADKSEPYLRNPRFNSADSSQSSQTHGLSKTESEDIAKRLADLGYL